MSPRKIISQELIDWASDDELVEGENVVSYTQLPIELDSKDDSLQQPTNITNEPTNQMEVVQKLFVSNGKNGVCHRDFMDNYIARFGALIWTLRHEQNWVIDKEWCEDKSHNHKSNQYKYAICT